MIPLLTPLPCRYTVPVPSTTTPDPTWIHIRKDVKDRIQIRNDLPGRIRIRIDPPAVFRNHIDLNKDLDPDPAIEVNTDPDPASDPDQGFIMTKMKIFLFNFISIFESLTT